MYGPEERVCERVCYSKGNDIFSTKDENSSGQQHWSLQILEFAAFALSSRSNSVKDTLIEGSIVLTGQNPMHSYGSVSLVLQWSAPESI